VLNPCNIRWSAAEILYSLEDSGSTILLVDETFRGMVEQMRAQATSLREVIYCGDGALPAGMHGYERLIDTASPVPDAVRRDEDLAGIFYTGGTTGFPKGVMLSHANMCSSGLALHAEHLAPPDGGYLHAAPMFHLADMGLAAPHWFEGNTHSIVPAFSPEAVLNAIENDRVTHVLLVPTMIQVLVDHPAMRQPRDLSSLKCITYGASPISEAVLNRAMNAFPGVDFVQAYGMTELSPLATINPARNHTAEGRKLGKLRSAGRASYCTEVRIVDADGAEVPRGTVGEVAVRGPNVMQGYWNKPEQTAAAVRNGWMHTGDGAYMDDDGYIFVVDRLKDMIISGGENIYSAEVENAITQHPAVAACAVIGIRARSGARPCTPRWCSSRAGHPARRAHCPLQDIDRQLQMPAQRGRARRAAVVGCRQGAEDQAARTLLAGAPARRGLNLFFLFHPFNFQEFSMSQDVHVVGVGMIPFTQARCQPAVPADGRACHQRRAEGRRHRL
jgi:acyl-CoA synthetase (AMP-forming)/AMP-acid ligase II